MVPLLFALLFASFAGRSVGQEYDATEILVDESKHDEQFFTFLSRPGIEAPRWNFTVYDEEALAPGYWFVSPYGIVEQDDGDVHDYVAPSIYDPRNGELVWNGEELFGGFNTFNFKVSKYHGKDMLSIMQMREEAGLLINDNYISHRHIRASGNLHDFQLVEDGDKALYITVDVKAASREDSLAVNYDGGCITRFTGFQERDTQTEEITFDWSPEGKIGLDESYLFRDDPIEEEEEPHSPEKDCPHNSYDYVHLNSVEKLPDGDYLVSGRRTYTIYKISHKDGSIVWRLGGKKSDFQLDDDTHFTGQHDARCLEQTDSHIIISMMDNAVGPHDTDKTNPNSRGLVLSVDTRNFTAKTLRKFKHPYGLGAYSPDRGNVQILSNGNAFVSWTRSALHSEHAPNGDVIAVANLPAGLKTYRSYKFPWTGKPQNPPDVFSQLVSVDGGSSFRTIVSVSWNGDTRAARWNLYRSDANDTVKELVHSTPRTGFETTLFANEHMPFVKVDAEDDQGHKLKNSESYLIHTVAMLDEHGSVVGAERPDVLSWSDIIQNRIFIFFGGVLACAVAVLTGHLVWRFWGRGAFSWAKEKQTYTPLKTESDDIEPEG